MRNEIDRYQNLVSHRELNADDCSSDFLSNENDQMNDLISNSIVSDFGSTVTVLEKSLRWVESSLCLTSNSTFEHNMEHLTHIVRHDCIVEEDEEPKDEKEIDQ